MRNSLVLIFLFVLLSPNVQAATKSQTQMVSVEIELEEIPGIVTYEIEVKKIGKKKESIQKFSQKSPDFKIKTDAGNYLVRTRVIAKNLQQGPWSEWTELLARPEEVNLIEAAVYNIPVSKRQNSADISVQWENANGADRYVVWIEVLQSKKVVKKTTTSNKIMLNLNVGEYRVGVQTVSKDNLKSDIKYFENSFYVAYTKLPQIKLERPDRETFKWPKLKESDVKIDIYRKPFFGNNFVKIETLKENGEGWRLPKDLKPGEYRIDFQYISETFVNGPVETIQFVKKPTEFEFLQSIQ